MNIRNVKKALPVLLKNNICPMFWGSQGIGKTQSVKQYCKEHNLDLVVLHTATQEVGDLIGLLVHGENGTVHHARPGWFPTQGKGIVFLDELNRAPQDVIQAMFPFITEGKLHTHELPSGWRIVAAGNYNSDRFTVTDTSDSAWMSRFCHIDFTPTTEEWLVYAEDRNMHEAAAFIREQPSMLELGSKEAGRLDMSFIVPDRRAWTEGIGRLEIEDELDDELKFEVYSGLVGTAAASAYMSWKNKKEKALHLGQILGSYKGAVRKRVQELADTTKESRFDLLNQPIDELIVKIDGNAEYLSANNYLSNLKEFLTDIPRELAMKAFSRLAKIGKFYGRHDILNDVEFTKKFL